MTTPRRLLTLGAAVIALTAITPPPSHASSKSAAQTRIIATHSNKCLDVQNALTGDNVPIQQYTCDGSAEQSFELRPQGGGVYNIVASHSGKCFDVTDARTGDNVPIRQYTCDGSAEQRFALMWRREGVYNIVATHSNKCLDVPNAQMGDSVPIQQYSCDGSAEQLFAVTLPTAPTGTSSKGKTKMAPQPAYGSPPPSRRSSAPAGPMVDKVKIICDDKARNDGELRFHFTPATGGTIDVRVTIEEGMRKQATCRDIAKELKVALGPRYEVDHYDDDKVKIEGKDDQEFSLTLGSQTVTGLSIRLK